MNIKKLKKTGSKARCLLNSAYVKAKLAAGADWGVVLNSGKEVLRKACVCPDCQQSTSERRTAA